jgi:adenylyltransferase/sulfurtransferase
LARLREQGDCRVCRRGQFDWLSGEHGSDSAVLCGRNSVQISPSGHLAASISLDELASRLADVGRVERNRYLLRLSVDGFVLTVFADGRTIISGTDDLAAARTLHARYIGS